MDRIENETKFWGLDTDRLTRSHEAQKPIKIKGIHKQTYKHRRLSRQTVRRLHYPYFIFLNKEINPKNPRTAIIGPRCVFSLGEIYVYVTCTHKSVRKSTQIYIV